MLTVLIGKNFLPLPISSWEKIKMLEIHLILCQTVIAQN